MKEPDKDLVKRFEKRTAEHIARVVKNMMVMSKKYAKTDPKISFILSERSKKHDLSKYGKIERIPYIYITEFYRAKNAGEDFSYPPGMKRLTDIASKHHVESNRHHPEYHKKPSDMSVVDVIEMVCDWAAMSQELGDSLKGWADKNVNKKWMFNPDQVRLIYKVVGIFEK